MLLLLILKQSVKTLHKSGHEIAETWCCFCYFICCYFCCCWFVFCFVFVVVVVVSVVVSVLVVVFVGDVVSIQSQLKLGQ